MQKNPALTGERRLREQSSALRDGAGITADRISGDQWEIGNVSPPKIEVCDRSVAE